MAARSVRDDSARLRNAHICDQLHQLITDDPHPHPRNTQRPFFFRQRMMESQMDGCRAGSDCPFVHDSSRYDRAQHEFAAKPEVTLGRIPSEPARGQALAERVRAAESSQVQQTHRRYQPPPVDVSRVVERPIPRFQKESPRDFQIRQLERRFPSLQKAENDSETTLGFQLVPSDPDFPFEMAGLDCALHVPSSFPGHGKPSLAVKNKDMPRGYQINVERGFDALVQATPHATLLSLMNALDKRLEALLTVEKAETIKLMPNAPRIPDQVDGTAGKPTKALQEIARVERPRAERPQYTPEQRQAAQLKRKAEIRQLEARLGRLPRFSKKLRFQA
ncbi:MAG: hypothetical protein Q9210_003095 [Variospora velana]